MSSCHQKKKTISIADLIPLSEKNQTDRCVYQLPSEETASAARAEILWNANWLSEFADSIEILLMAFRINFLNQNIRDYNLGLVNVLLTLESIYDKSFNPNMRTVVKHIWIYWVVHRHILKDICLCLCASLFTHICLQSHLTCRLQHSHLLQWLFMRETCSKVTTAA